MQYFHPALFIEYGDNEVSGYSLRIPNTTYLISFSKLAETT
jgi:hypothetical protein